MKGTFYKSANFCGTWFNDNLNVPFFSQDSTVFTVTSSKINKDDGLKISKDTLQRLANERYSHKDTRKKFDKSDPECLKQQNNKKMTFEDNIHQGTTETYF